MKPHGKERDKLEDFRGFAEAVPLTPRRATDQAVYRTVKGLGRRTAWRGAAKLLLIHLCSGIVTLAACPQFGIGAASHAPWLHALHGSADSPLLYYASCGAFFVLFGAVLSGLSFNRIDHIAFGGKRFVCFALYGLFAYLVFIFFGAEGFLVGSLAWVGGAVAGDVIGFEVGVRLRTLAAPG